MSACERFRRALVDELSGAGPGSELGWHEHLVGCLACRRLLQAEEALDLLLASLPEPRLPRDLARRVLARLAGERSGLDRLLDRDPTPRAPSGLAGRVLEALAPERVASDPLDRLLGSLPEPALPPDLAERLLARLAPRRGRGGRAPRLLPKLALALAAAAVVALGVLRAWRRGDPAPEPPPRLAGSVPDASEVPDALLENLELLEAWEHVAADDLDLWLDDLDVAEVTLIEHGLAEPEEDEG